MKFEASDWMLRSISRAKILTPLPTSLAISSTISFNLLRRRAIRTSLRLRGEALANSKAADRPMPDDAPVMTMVLLWSWLCILSNVLVTV